MILKGVFLPFGPVTDNPDLTRRKIIETDFRRGKHFRAFRASEQRKVEFSSVNERFGKTGPAEHFSSGCHYLIEIRFFLHLEDGIFIQSYLGMLPDGFDDLKTGQKTPGGGSPGRYPYRCGQTVLFKHLLGQEFVGGQKYGFRLRTRVWNFQIIEKGRSHVDQATLSGDGFDKIKNKIWLEQAQVVDQAGKIQGNGHGHGLITLFGKCPGNDVDLNQDILFILVCSFRHFTVQDDNLHR